MLTKLRHAARYEGQVIREVEDYYLASVAAHHLVAAAAVDLEQPRTRDEFLKFAPLVVQVLAQLDESAIDFQSTRWLEIDLGSGDLLPIELQLDAGGRTAERFIEDLCGCALADALAEGLGGLLKQAADDAHEQLSRRRRQTDNMSDPKEEHRRVELRFVDLVREFGTVTVRFAGALQAHYTAFLVRENRHSADYELQDLFREVEIDRDFTLAASWTSTAGPGRPDRVTTAVVRDNIMDAEEEARIAWLEDIYEARRDDRP